MGPLSTYKIWNDPPSICISPSVSCFLFPLVVKWHHSLALHWSCAWKRPRWRLPRIRHQGMWKVGHSKASKKRTSWHPNVSTYPLKFSGTTQTCHIWSPRYQIPFTRPWLLDPWVSCRWEAHIHIRLNKGPMLQHFLLFLTPLQDLWENLPKNKKQQGNFSSFQSALWLFWPCRAANSTSCPFCWSPKK